MNIEITIDAEQVIQMLKREIFDHDEVPYGWRNRIKITSVVSFDQIHKGVPELRVFFTLEPEKEDDE